MGGGTSYNQAEWHLIPTKITRIILRRILADMTTNMDQIYCTILEKLNINSWHPFENFRSHLLLCKILLVFVSKFILERFSIHRIYRISNECRPLRWSWWLFMTLRYIHYTQCFKQPIPPYTYLCFSTKSNLFFHIRNETCNFMEIIKHASYMTYHNFNISDGPLSFVKK